MPWDSEAGLIETSNLSARSLASLAARDLNAPQLLQASIETGPPPDAGAFAFLAMVFLAPEAFLAGAAFFFFGMAALQATAVRSCVHCQLAPLWDTNTNRRRGRLDRRARSQPIVFNQQMLLLQEVAQVPQLR